jgi:hypothetical protein
MSGFGIGSAPLIADTVYLGTGDGRLALIFGLARDPIVRIDLVPLDDPSTIIASVDVVTLPGEVADGVSAFSLEVSASSLPANARGIDEDGTVIEEWLCGGANLDEAKGQPVPQGGCPSVGGPCTAPSAPMVARPSRLPSTMEPRARRSTSIRWMPTSRCD